MDFFSAIEALNKEVKKEEHKTPMLHNGVPLLPSHNNTLNKDSKAIAKGKYELFVYGTLKRNNFRHATLKGCSFIGEGHLDNSFKLVQNNVNIHSATFPVLIRKENHDDKEARVLGEIYLVDDAVIRILDIIENEPRMYRRETIPVRRDIGDGVTEIHRCITYVGNPVYWRGENLYPTGFEKLSFPSYIFNPTSRKA